MGQNSLIGLGCRPKPSTGARSWPRSGSYLLELITMGWDSIRQGLVHTMWEEVVGLQPLSGSKKHYQVNSRLGQTSLSAAEVTAGIHQVYQDISGISGIYQGSKGYMRDIRDISGISGYIRDIRIYQVYQDILGYIRDIRDISGILGMYQ